QARQHAKAQPRSFSTAVDMRIPEADARAEVYGTLDYHCGWLENLRNCDRYHAGASAGFVIDPNYCRPDQRDGNINILSNLVPRILGAGLELASGWKENAGLNPYVRQEPSLRIR